MIESCLGASEGLQLHSGMQRLELGARLKLDQSKRIYFLASPQAHDHGAQLRNRSKVYPTLLLRLLTERSMTCELATQAKVAEGERADIDMLTSLTPLLCSLREGQTSGVYKGRDQLRISDVASFASHTQGPASAPQ